MARKILHKGRIAIALILSLASYHAGASLNSHAGASLKGNAVTTKSKLGQLIISVHGLRSGKGKLALSVFSEESKTGFPGEAKEAAQTFYIELNGATQAEVKSKPLPFGIYAIAMMHDEDGDGKFGTTFFGIPKEGFGFSRNPTVLFGAPPFKACGMELQEKEMAVSITAKYIL